MSADTLTLPETTRLRLLDFRQRVRLVKITEGVLAAACGMLLSWLTVFFLDRLTDTPPVVRGTLLVAGCLGGAIWLPLVWHRWVWKTRRLEQVAVLLKHRFPALGDQLLGIVELVHSTDPTGRSQSLARAAVEQVDAAVRRSHFDDAVPFPRRRQWGIAAAIPAITTLMILLLAPDAGANALQRWLTPWREIPRYTFAQIQPLPEEFIVPSGEPFSLDVTLAEQSRWSPATATVQYETQRPVTAERSGSHYTFAVPPQTESGRLALQIGDLDAHLRVRVEPRPELSSLDAFIRLPEYLQREDVIEADVRGGMVSILQGALAAFDVGVNRPLSTANVNGAPLSVQQDHVQIPELLVDASSELVIGWKDKFGFTAASPFALRINAIEDAAPGVILRQEDPHPVVLSTELVTFQIHARDDFGVRSVGLEWHPQVDSETDLSVEADRKTVAAGGPDQVAVKAAGTFSAASDGVRPQTLELRAWAEDYRPGRGRVYSPSIVLHVLTPDEHAAWMTGQLRRWASLSEDVYEEELRLHDVNRRLRGLTADERAAPEARQQLEQQATAERANGRRLDVVTQQGESLIRRALQNPEIQAAHLETWASSLSQLQQIAGSRMPSVADLLSEEVLTLDAAADTATAQQPADDVPYAGNDRSETPPGPPTASQNNDAESPSSQAPGVVDVESGFNQTESPEGGETAAADGPSQGRLSLPSTTLEGGPAPQQSGSAGDDETKSKIEQAVQEQAELLAQFQTVRDDLQSILDDLENSTFVKRFKAASRHQMEVAADLNRTLQSAFGIDAAQLSAQEQGQNAHIADREDMLSRRVGEIQSDLQAYLDRTQEERFAAILEEMQESRVIDALQEVGVAVRQNHTGEAIARAEYWCDTLDRWGEELVAPAKQGGSKGGSKASLPPAVVLEVMRILKSEIDLREATRATEQAREGLTRDGWRDQAVRLSQDQENIQQRVNDVMTDILALPAGAENFGDEVELLSMAGEAMYDAAGTLARPDTGPVAIAAETEAIEILLRSRRCNPNAGGGGGTSPGGGGEGATEVTALALFGPASDPHAVIEHRGVSHASANQDDALPEEFREGLDAFFNAVERVSQRKAE